MHNAIVSVLSQIDSFSPQLNNITNSLYDPHISYLKSKLHNVLEQLNSFEPNRVKRGLINGLGSVIKGLTGNLDHTDALHYDQALKSLQDNADKLVSEFNNHVSLSKEWSTQYSKIIDSISDNQKSIETLLNKIRQDETTNSKDLVKYAHVAQILMILSDNVDSFSQKLTKYESMLAFIGAAGTLCHEALNLDMMRAMISKLNILYSREGVLDLDIREYYDIVKVGSYYTSNKIVIVYKFPITLPSIYDMYKLCIVPNRHHEILSPPYPFLAIHKKDFRYIEAECPKTSKWYLCKEKHSLQNRSPRDCIYQLITTQQRNDMCSPITVSLDKPAYEQLDERHYSISLPTPTKVHLSCGQNLYKTLQGSYLAIIPHRCTLETPQFTISNSNDRIEGQVLKILNLDNYNFTSESSVPVLKLNSINLDHLHASSAKISLQSPTIMQNASSTLSIYHTTIPLYAVILCSCLLTSIIYYRYRLKNLKKPEGNPDEVQLGTTRDYAIPMTRRVVLDPPPAQFTTSVFNNRCSSAGGVTQG